MMRFISALVASLLTIVATYAGWQSRDSNYDLITAAAFSGVADAVSATPFAWVSCTRAMSASYAAAGSNACQFQRNGGTTCIAVFATNGNIDLTVGTPCSGQTVTAWAGTNASCTGSISTTVLTVTSCSSGTIGFPDNISGTGVTANTYITSNGTGTGGAGTYNLSASMTVSSETITATPSALNTITAYDHSGNGHNLTAGTGIPINTNCINSHPCWAVGASGGLLNSGAISAQAQPTSWSFVGERISGFTSFQTPFSSFSGTGDLFGWNNTANTGRIFAGSATVTFTISDSAWHSASAVFNGASSVINVDGTETTGSPGASATNTVMNLGDISGHGNQFTGNMTEAGFWSSALSSTQRTNLRNNQKSYYGTP